MTSAAVRQLHHAADQLDQIGPDDLDLPDRVGVGVDVLRLVADHVAELEARMATLTEQVAALDRLLAQVDAQRRDALADRDRLAAVVHEARLRVGRVIAALEGDS